MALGLNPVGDVLKKADGVLAAAADTLGEVGHTLESVDGRMAKVDTTLADVTVLLGEVRELLSGLDAHLALVQEIPQLRALLEDVHRAVTASP